VLIRAAKLVSNELTRQASDLLELKCGFLSILTHTNVNTKQLKVQCSVALNPKIIKQFFVLLSWIWDLY